MSTDLNIKLLPWQQKVWNKVVRFKVVAAGRRTGKTLLAVYLLLYYALQAKAGHVFYVAPTQGQARDIMWQVLLEKGNAVIKSSHINNLQVTLINGATISLKGADRPETMRGVSLKYLVMDEYADMKPEVWEQILRPALADQKGGALFIGTPMGRNHFYDLYKYAEDEEGDDTWNAWHFTSYDNPLLDAKEIDAAKKSMSSFAFRQEFMASFEAQGSDLFKEEWIQMDTQEPTDGSYYLAIDMAGFEDATTKKKKKSRLDSTSIACVKVNESGWWVDDIIHGRWTFEETAERIFEAVEKYQPLGVGIEKGISKQAIMSPLTDMMRQRNTFFTIQELTHGNKRKVDRIVAALQGRFEHGTITLNKGEWNIQFLDELFQFPNPQVHDDLIDSLAYIDQLAQVTYYYDFEEDNFEALDTIAGY